MIKTMPTVITDEGNEELVKMVTVKEVHRAILFMKAYKSPGPNGFLPAFFQHFWELIKLYLLLAAHDFLRTRKLLK